MVQVSSVEKVQGRRVRIVLEDGSRYYILRSMYQERPVAEGDEIDPKEYAQWVLTRQYRSALDKAVSMLAVRACSKGEIKQKLQRIGYSPETIEMVIYKLEKNDLLNDQDFAAQWAQYRSGQKYGPRRISQELRHKGVSAEETAIAIEDVSEEEQLASALTLAQKNIRHAWTEEDPRKAKQKAIASIVRRGFSWDIARQAVEQVFGDLDEA
ncbi:MAG: regulatory protein RecX [Clostridia bacterium]|nr:regulatory protein RecX [Clostridia bacterium]